MEIYIARDGKQIGPFNEEELTQKIEREEISYEDFAWVEGMAEWQPLRQISSPPSKLSPAKFKNRKISLTVFGVLTLIGGLLLGLLTIQSGSVLAGVILTVVLIWLGIGSIMTRRWARALLLITAWIMLTYGIFLVPFGVSVLIPLIVRLMCNPLPSAAQILTMQFTLGLAASVIFVLIPAVWVFFYGSKHVKATCEACDPIERWTDRCPLPVIAVSLYVAIIGAWSLIGGMLNLPEVTPFFGTFLSGALDNRFCNVQGVVLIYGAWAMYELDLRGWWTVLAVDCLRSISNIITFWRHDTAEFFQLSGCSMEQINALQQFSFFSRGGMISVNLFFSFVTIGYLLYSKKFFTKEIGH